MTQYIDKAALVAEIERISFKNFFDGSLYVDTEELLTFLNTLEVKEVDLEKEYEKYYEQERYIQTFKLAKHFFELGIAASNKTKKGE